MNLGRFYELIDKKKALAEDEIDELFDTIRQLTAERDQLETECIARLDSIYSHARNEERYLDALKKVVASRNGTFREVALKAIYDGVPRATS